MEIDFENDPNCRPIFGNNGEIKAHVCVVPKKDMDKLEILLIPQKDDPVTFDSPARFAKWLKENTRSLSPREIAKSVNFVSKKLRAIKKKRQNLGFDASYAGASGGISTSSENEV